MATTLFGPTHEAKLCHNNFLMNSADQAIRERVYDRAEPSRKGTALYMRKCEWVYYVAWDDGQRGWIDIDQLGYDG